MPTIHPNYTKASNLTLLLLAIGLANFFFVTYPQLQSGQGIVVFVFIIVIFGGMAYLLRKGIKWVKYFFLVIFVLGHISPSNWIDAFTHGIVRIISAIIVLGISIWILWLLFTISNESSANKKGPDLSEPL
jgi:hypothetical protein